MRRFGPLFPVLMSILSAAFLPGCGFGERSDILLLVREGDATSRAIAESYAEARDVPADRILELALSGPPDLVEIDSRTYLSEIVEPIERHLAEQDPGGDISILITTRPAACRSLRSKTPLRANAARRSR